MTISEIIVALEKLAPPILQEDYDNCGLLIGDGKSECFGVIATLDVTQEVVEEAIAKKCNLIVAHHPIIFKGLKKINGKNYVERAVISSIKNDIAIYAIHTNLDNITHGVNRSICEKLKLTNTRILLPKTANLFKLLTYVPVANAENVLNELFNAGAGHISNYAECSFQTIGTGTFMPGPATNPYIGEVGKRHFEQEAKLEVILPAWSKDNVLQALIKAHPYEEVAYDLVQLANTNDQTGSGMIGTLDVPIDEATFMKRLKKIFKVPVIRHSAFIGRDISTVAVCGGTGSFLLPIAIAAAADVFITADFKYHEFFDAEGKLVIADIGHYESEQYTIDLLTTYLTEKFPTFAVLKTEINTNPVQYFT